MKYKVKDIGDAIDEWGKALEHLYNLEDLMSYRKNKLTKIIDILQKMDFKGE